MRVVRKRGIIFRSCCVLYRKARSLVMLRTCVVGVQVTLRADIESLSPLVFDAESLV